MIGAGCDWGRTGTVCAGSCAGAGLAWVHGTLAMTAALATESVDLVGGRTVLSGEFLSKLPTSISSASMVVAANAGLLDHHPAKSVTHQ
jgi:hypothetical protein